MTSMTNIVNISDVTEKIYGKYPEKVLQFGEGNFLRAFADWMIDMANEGGVFDGSIVICQPIASGMCDTINAQNGIYTLVMRGQENGRAQERIRKITSVSRCINIYENYEKFLELAGNPEIRVLLSNTTEAGISYHAGDTVSDRPPHSYPAKLCAFLSKRYRTLGDSTDSELLVLPVELIDDNGGELSRILTLYATEWALGDDFLDWMRRRIHIASTLVDRIVTGYPKDETELFQRKLGYQDDLLVTGELFNLWVIEGDSAWAGFLPIHETDANVIWTDDVTPYKKRKVRILNGAHTSIALAGWLAGYSTVLEVMGDNDFRDYLDALLNVEIIPTLDLPKKELDEYAASVLARFSNTFLQHRLLDISLNSCSKYAARCLPSLIEFYEQRGFLPKRLVFALAALLVFYQGRLIEGHYIGTRSDGEAYEIADDAAIIAFFSNVWINEDIDTAVVEALANADLWAGNDLSLVPGLSAMCADYVRIMMKNGVKAALISAGGLA